jgi:cytochrome d ubiquinol oxidase subunit I
MWFPYVTVIAGWVLAEVGRYPFVVYGAISQFDAVSPNMTQARITTSLALFIAIDLLLIGSMFVLSRRHYKRGAPLLDDTYGAAPDALDFTGNLFGDGERLA